MNLFATLVLLAWLPLAMLAFALLRPRTAVLLVLVVGFLFLPQHSIPIPGFFDYSRNTAMSWSLLLGVLLFDRRSLLAFRPHWLDLALVIWLLAAPLASIANNLGGYDATSALMNRSLVVGIPYLAGATYLRSREGLRDVLWAVFLGGLVYVPLCLIEVRFSPQLHRLVYGDHQHGFVQTIRGSGFRPMVFTENGLELALWMAAAMLSGTALWRLLRVTRFAGLPMAWLVVAVGVTLVLCKSFGALMLGCLGLFLLAPGVGPWLRRALLFAIPIYLGLRLFGSGALEETLVAWSTQFSQDRAGSLQFRFENEALLLETFWKQLWFGAGAWNFNVRMAESGDASTIVTDSLWIITLATNGLLGFLGFLGSLWIPVARGIGLGLRRARGVAVELMVPAVIVLIYLADCMVNGLVHPVYVAIAGGLVRAQHAASSNVAPQPRSLDSEPIMLRPRSTPAPGLVSRRSSSIAWLRPRTGR